MAIIYISAGSNVQPKKYVLSGIEALSKVFSNIQLSPCYESESVGFSGNNFLNLVIRAETNLSISLVVERLKQIENEHGRIRNIEKFSDRTLDLDLLLFDDVVCDAPVELPRDEIHKHAFVLKPLMDLIPNEVHPCLQKTYAQLWTEFTDEQKLWEIDLCEE